MTARVLDDRRLLVVGASSGIGHAVAGAALAAGARVALAARRRAPLDQLASEADGRGLVLACDVRDSEAVAVMVDRAATELGGLDAVVYAAAVTRLGALADAGADDWHDVLETNLVGASLTLRAALTHLRTSGGRAFVLSSDSVAYPFPGLGPYAASKAALDKMIEAWRGEHDDVGFTRVVIGPTTTDAAAGWDPDDSARYFQLWADRGLLREGLVPQSPDEVADRLVALLADPAPPDDVELLPPGMPSVLECSRRSDYR